MKYLHAPNDHNARVEAITQQILFDSIHRDFCRVGVSENLPPLVENIPGRLIPLSGDNGSKKSRLIT